MFLLFVYFCIYSKVCLGLSLLQCILFWSLIRALRRNQASAVRCVSQVHRHILPTVVRSIEIASFSYLNVYYSTLP
jgi:hypothetical protein